MEILQKYANLFWVPWACTVTRTQNDSITLLKTSIFICMQKISFAIHFFLTILHFKESCNLIGRQHFGPKLETQNYARCFGEISITILIFIIDYIREKLTWQNFSKNQKNPPILEPLWALFAQIWAKNEFFLEKRTLLVFQYSNHLPFCQKSEKFWTDTPKTSLFH